MVHGRANLAGLAVPAMRGMSLSIGAAALLALFSSATVAAPLRCDISVKQRCQPTTGCGAVPAKVFNLVDLSRGTYSRCDEAGCDNYEGTMSKSGAFVLIDLVGRGMVAKIEADTLKFLEVVTLTTDVVFVSWGTCSETPGG